MEQRVRTEMIRVQNLIHQFAEELKTSQYAMRLLETKLQDARDEVDQRLKRTKRRRFEDPIVLIPTCKTVLTDKTLQELRDIAFTLGRKRQETEESIEHHKKQLKNATEDRDLLRVGKREYNKKQARLRRQEKVFASSDVHWHPEVVHMRNFAETFTNERKNQEEADLLRQVIQEPI